MATSTIEYPSLSTLVAASIEHNVNLADLIVALDKSYATATIAETPAPMPATTTRTRKPAQTTPNATKVTAKKAAKKAEVKSSPKMRETTDGRMMNAEDGTATKNQVARNTAFAKKHGFIVEDFASYSMADASDWLTDAKASL
jgi:hypothetical protein